MTNMSNKGVSPSNPPPMAPLIHRRKNEFVHSLFTYWLYSSSASHTIHLGHGGYTEPAGMQIDSAESRPAFQVS